MRLTSMTAAVAGMNFDDLLLASTAGFTPQARYASAAKLEERTPHGFVVTRIPSFSMTARSLCPGRRDTKADDAMAQPLALECVISTCHAHIISLLPLLTVMTADST